MIVDFQDKSASTSYIADICIIGAGPAGLTIARSFSNSNTTVCLVESGGFEVDTETQNLYTGENKGLPYNISTSRARFFGGTSNHWAGQCGLLNSSDFDTKEWLPHSGWPFEYQELLNYYPGAHKLIGLGNFDYTTKNYEDVDLKPFQLESDALKIHFWRFSNPPKNFGEDFKSEITKSTNITALLHANITNIDIASTGTRVKKIKIKTLDGKSGFVQARHFVLACGGLETPRILLNSNSFFKHGIGNQKDLVGRFFMEHPNFIIGDLSLNNKALSQLSDYFLWSHRDTVSKNKWRGALTLSEQFQAKNKILNGCVRINMHERRTGALGNIPKTSKEKILPYVSSNFDGVLYNIYRRIMGEKRMIPWESKPLPLLLELEQAPNPNSRIYLSSDKDQLGMQRIVLEWKLNQLEKRSVNFFANTLANEMGKLNWGRLRIKDWVLSEDLTWPDDLGYGAHHIGTTRMASNNSQGVVDHNCQVFGINNLFIAGSSVFPTGGYVNPTLTIVALSLRLADHLKRNIT